MSPDTSFAHGMWGYIAMEGRDSPGPFSESLRLRGHLWPGRAADARAQVQDMGEGGGVDTSGVRWEGRKAARLARGDERLVAPIRAPARGRVRQGQPSDQPSGNTVYGFEERFCPPTSCPAAGFAVTRHGRTYCIIKTCRLPSRPRPWGQYMSE